MVARAGAVPPRPDLRRRQQPHHQQLVAPPPQRQSDGPLRALLQSEISVGPPRREVDAFTFMEKLPRRRFPLDRRLEAFHGLPPPLLQIRTPTRDQAPRPHPWAHHR
ncbi:hypothetical protein LINGRAHAP2_LOCUS16819 [Linum grandiflorum]